MTNFTLTPAYGRDYSSKEAVVNDLTNGKDFVIANVDSPWCGSYISIRDMSKGDAITLRFGKLRKTALHTV